MSSSDTPKKILLKGDPIRKEETAGAAITPGMLLTYDVNGDVIAHNVTGGNAAKMFAFEQDFLGKSISDAYADGDIVQYGICRSGDEVYALLEVGADVNKGALLESNGAGALQAFTNQANQFSAIVCRALEDKNNSAGSGAVRIKVEVM